MSSKSKLHARRRAARFGDLDALLVEALRDQRRGEGAVKRLKGINQAIHEQYSNPANWVDRGILLIIYVDERTGASETIGKFQESVHRTGARKLTRIADDLAPANSIAKDRDPFLVRGKIDPCPPVPKGDHLAQLAIRDYLKRVKEQSLAETLGVSQVDASALLNQLKQMGVEKLQ